jgi:hypothetical protein
MSAVTDTIGLLQTCTSTSSAWRCSPTTSLSEAFGELRSAAGLSTQGSKLDLAADHALR